MCDVWLAITILLGWNVWGEDGDPWNLCWEWPLALQIFSSGVQVSLTAVTLFIKLKFLTNWGQAAKWVMFRTYSEEDQKVNIILSYITSLSQPGPHETLKPVAVLSTRTHGEHNESRKGNPIVSRNSTSLSVQEHSLNKQDIQEQNNINTSIQPPVEEMSRPRGGNVAWSVLLKISVTEVDWLCSLKSH